MINEKLNELLSTESSAYWIERLEAQRIPCAPVNRFSQALSDPQVLHRNMVIDLEHPNGKSTRGPGNPVKLSRTAEESFSPAPEVGQHTDSVLEGLLDYTPERIARLRAAGVIL